MDEASLEEALLLALRRSSGSRPAELAEAVGLPRTNFGRQLTYRLEEPLEHLLAEGLIEEDRGRYQLTREGRTKISERVDAARSESL
jgi:DNA-binding IclR family transcriptional regulator